MIEPLPDELAQLISAERTAPVTDAVARAAVRAKLSIAVGHAPLGAAGIGVAGKVLAILAVVVGAGAGAKVLLDHHAAGSSRPAATTGSNAREATAVMPATAAPANAMPATVTASVASRAPTAPPAAVATHRARAAAFRPTASPAPAAVVASAPTEAELLRQAWATRDASVALELVQRDAALHPDGALEEERVALEVRALADLHRLDEARATAARLFSKFPQTVHRAIVERALARKDTP